MQGHPRQNIWDTGEGGVILLDLAANPHSPFWDTKE